MSFLDLDEWLINLAAKVELVYSPFADIKEYPEGVDIILVEGAVANEDNLELIKQVRDRSNILVSFGDCAVSGNVTAMRNPFGNAESFLQRSYVEAADIQNQIPYEPGIVPTLLDRVLPVHIRSRYRCLSSWLSSQCRAYSLYFRNVVSGRSSPSIREIDLIWLIKPTSFFMFFKVGLNRQNNL